MESAIDRSLAAFERRHGLLVTVHDLDGSLAGLVDPLRTRHRHAICTEMKDGPRAVACHRFEVGELHPAVGRLAGGRVHRCHAGLVEWVMPVAGPAGRPCAILFAGPCRWVGPSGGLVDAEERPHPGRSRLPAVDAAAAADVLELLAQLAARIEQTVRGLPRPGGRTPRTRLEILQLLLRHHGHEPIGLDDLARRWGVGRGRASHLVAELTGSTWRGLLLAHRLRIACHLLRTTDLPVQRVAERAGFTDRAAFGRAFAAACGASPGRWRRMQDAWDPRRSPPADAG